MFNKQWKLVIQGSESVAGSDVLQYVGTKRQLQDL